MAKGDNKKPAKKPAKKPVKRPPAMSDKELDRLMGGSVSNQKQSVIVERDNSNHLFGAGKLFGQGRVTNKGAWARPIYGQAKYRVIEK